MSPFLCAKLQFHGHHSYFRKDFQMLLTLKEGQGPLVARALKESSSEIAPILTLIYKKSLGGKHI